MYIIAASLLPVVILLFYIYKRDTFQKEPFPLLMKALLFGVLAVVIDIPVASVSQFIVPKVFSSPGWDAFHAAFFSAAFPEEFCKLLMLYLCIWKNPHFDEYYDDFKMVYECVNPSEDILKELEKRLNKQD